MFLPQLPKIVSNFSRISSSGPTCALLRIRKQSNETTWIVAVFYAYAFALRGTQTTIEGAAFDYAFPPNGQWQYTCDTTYFVVEENDGATAFNGDGDTNEFVDTDKRFGGAWEQTAMVGGASANSSVIIPFRSPTARPLGALVCLTST